MKSRVTIVFDEFQDGNKTLENRAELLVEMSFELFGDLKARLMDPTKTYKVRIEEEK